MAKRNILLGFRKNKDRGYLFTVKHFWGWVLNHDGILLRHWSLGERETFKKMPWRKK